MDDVTMFWFAASIVLNAVLLIAFVAVKQQNDDLRVVISKHANETRQVKRAEARLAERVVAKGTHHGHHHQRTRG